MVAVPSIFTSRLSCPVTEAAASSARMSGANDLMVCGRIILKCY